MKKKFILSIFGIGLLFAACQEDTYFDDYYVDERNSSVLTEAMKLIGDNYDHVTLPDLGKTLGGNTATRGRGGKKHSMSLENEDFTFDWNNAEIISSSKAEAAIVPVKQNKEIALQSVVAKGNLHREETTPLHSILYVRKFLNDGKSYAHILSFAPDRDYANACEERGEEMQLYPNPQGSNYSGILFVSTIYGEISHGIRYENGRMCHYILPRSEKNRDFIEKYRNEHAECHEHCDSTHTRMSMNFITVNSATRSTYSTRSEYGGGSSSGYNCSICGKDVYDCTCVEIVACGVCKKDPCVCYDDIEQEEEERCVYCGFQKEYCHCYNDSWQDDYGNSHGPNPGNPYPNNPGHNSGGNSGNDGNTNSKPSEDVLLLGKISSTITGANIDRLNSALASFKNNPFCAKIYALLSAEDINPDITFSIEQHYDKDNEKIAAGFMPEYNKIVFFSGTDIDYERILEELIHATQFHCFDSDRFTESKGNIELEAKMTKDIIRHLTYGCCDTYLTSFYNMNSELMKEYTEWLYHGDNPENKENPEKRKPKDYSNYDSWYQKLLPDFNYPRVTVNMEDTTHPFLDEFYKEIKDIKIEDNEGY